VNLLNVALKLAAIFVLCCIGSASAIIALMWRSLYQPNAPHKRNTVEPPPVSEPAPQVHRFDEMVPQPEKHRPYRQQ
jgi:hypothetical protein